MNQIFKPAARERIRFDGDPQTDNAIDLRDRLAGRIEYDDGEPATILPADRRPGVRASGRDNIHAVGGTGRGASFRAPLTTISCESIVEYDDGNPATIAPTSDY